MAITWPTQPLQMHRSLQYDRHSLSLRDGVHDHRMASKIAKIHGQTMAAWRSMHRQQALINTAHRLSGSSTTEEGWQDTKKAPENQHQNEQTGTPKINTNVALI